jgi:hypothetical protein
MTDNGRRITPVSEVCRMVGLGLPTGYLTKCQDTCNNKVLTLVSTGFTPGLVTVNLESWHLTCSAPPTANGEALRQKAYARSVPVLPVSPDSSYYRVGSYYRASSYSRCGTPARYHPSIPLRAFPDSFHFQPLTVFIRCTVVHHAGIVKMGAQVVLRAFRQLMVGVRNPLPQHPPAFSFS